MTSVVRVLVDQPYEVLIGAGVMAGVSASLRPDTNRVAILHAPAVTQHAYSIGQSLRQEVVYVALPDAESAKTYATIEMCWDAFGAAKLTRSDAVISVGGGATTDVAGFAAASWLRGIDVIHVPTTLLAMVDAAVGGKTGINTPAGKNLVGAFHHPRAVFCDVDVLQTLPEADLRAGFGEIIKCGFIADSSILEDVRTHGADLVDAGHSLLASLIARSVAVKASVVADDFKESKPGGLGREVLNYGHTLGHAIELVHDYSWRHGEAISVGMIFAAELAAHAGVMSAEFVQEHRKLLAALGLPITCEQSRWDELLVGMAIDKKARGDNLRFVVLKGQGQPLILERPDVDTLTNAFRALAPTN